MNLHKRRQYILNHLQNEYQWVENHVQIVKTLTKKSNIKVVWLIPALLQDSILGQSSDCSSIQQSISHSFAVCVVG